VCVCVGKRPNDRTTGTKPNNRDRLLQHQQHQRYFCLTSTFKAHATPISLTKYYARTHARTHCVHVRKKNTHTTTPTQHTTHSCYTAAAYTSAVLVLTIQQQQRHSAQRSASQRSPPQQPTTNDEPKKKIPATRMKQSSHRQHPHSAAEQVKIPQPSTAPTDDRASNRDNRQGAHTAIHRTTTQARNDRPSLPHVRPPVEPAKTSSCDGKRTPDDFAKKCGVIRT